MLIAPEFAGPFEYKVRRKKNITGNIHYQSVREKAKRVCGYSPEVMVRITSFGKEPGRTIANLGYISRTDEDAKNKGKEPLDLETDRGEIISGAKTIREFAKEWEHDFGKPRKNRRDTMRLMLSMPPGTNPGAVKNATREFARNTFADNHEYVFVLHTDEKHPHCHLTVKMLGHNGKRLDPGREDLAMWREMFAKALREEGVDAEATRRDTRGVVRKAEKSVVRHIENSGRVPKAVVGRELDAIAILTAEHQGQQVEPGPWEAPIRAKQEAKRSAWLKLADVFDRVPRLAFRPEDHHARAQSAQAHASKYQAKLGVRPTVDPRKAPLLSSMGTIAGIPTLARMDTVGTGKRPGAVNQPVVLLPEDHHEQMKHAQKRGAAYQARLAAPRAGEPARPVKDLAALARIDLAGQSMRLQWRRPLKIASVRSMPTLASLNAPRRIAGLAPVPPPLVFNQEIQHERHAQGHHAAALYQSRLVTPRQPASRSVPSVRDLPRVDVVRRAGYGRRSAQMLLQQDARYLVGQLAGADHAMRRPGPGLAGDHAGGTGQGSTESRSSGAQGREGSGEGGKADRPGRTQEGSRGAQSGEGGREAAALGRPESASEATQGHGARFAGRPSYRSIGTVASILKLSDAISTAGADKALAAQIRSFVANMPPVETTRDVLKRRLAAQFTVPAAVMPQAVPVVAPQPAQPAPDTGQQKGAEPAAP